jgi:tetratricopeptide (TPR) repeat protein
MKFSKILYTVLVIVLPCLCFSRDTAQALFEKGNAYYAKAQYSEAVAAYQKIIDDGGQSPALYFNMGNASYKSGDIPSALLYYEKAHKLAPGDDDINFNIRFANLKNTDKVDAIPDFFLDRWWTVFMLSFSISALSVMSIVFMLLGSAILVVYVFANSVSLKKFSFYGSLLLYFLFAVAFFVAGRQTSYFQGHRQAIIFTSSVNVKNSPAEKSTTLFVVHDGTKVNVLDNSPGWMEIGLPNGNEGWIKTSDAREI